MLTEDEKLEWILLIAREVYPEVVRSVLNTPQRDFDRAGIPTTKLREGAASAALAFGTELFEQWLQKGYQNA